MAPNCPKNDVQTPYPDLALLSLPNLLSLFILNMICSSQTGFLVSHFPKVYGYELSFQAPALPIN